MSRTLHGTNCWECLDFNIKNTMGEECEGNRHIFCDKSLEEHDSKVRENLIYEIISELNLLEDSEFWFEMKEKTLFRLLESFIESKE